VLVALEPRIAANIKAPAPAPQPTADPKVRGSDPNKRPVPVIGHTRLAFRGGVIPLTAVGAPGEKPV
jgi:hypothetical protein